MKKLLILLLLMAGTAQAGDSWIGNDGGGSSDYAPGMWEQARGSTFNSGDSTGELDTLGFYINNDGGTETLTVAIYSISSGLITFVDSTAWTVTTLNGSGEIKIPVCATDARSNQTLTTNTRYVIFGYNINGQETGRLYYQRQFTTPPYRWNATKDGSWSAMASPTDTSGAVCVPGKAYFHASGPAAPVNGTLSQSDSSGSSVTITGTITNSADSANYFYDTNNSFAGSTYFGHTLTPSSPETKAITGLANAGTNPDTFWVWRRLWYNSGTLGDSDSLRTITKWVSPDKHIGIGRD